jgi:hypothetical protein
MLSVIMVNAIMLHCCYAECRGTVYVPMFRIYDEGNNLKRMEKVFVALVPRLLAVIVSI